MKKTIIKISFLTAICAMTALQGCSKFLDTCLDTNRTSETIKTERSSIWYFANAFYTPINYGYNVIDNNLFASASDEAQQTSAASDVIYFNNGMINQNVNPLSMYYNNYYEGIRAANYFLDFVADGKGEELLAQNRNLITDANNYKRDLASLKWYIAEAHIARAYYYSELIKMYGGVPIVEQTMQQNGGVMIPRSTYDEVVDYIVNEIDTWKGELAKDWTEFTEREGRFTLGTALAIKSRTLLYAASPLHNPEGDRSKWIKAAEAANEFLTCDEIEYSLDPEYDKYFIGSNSLASPETIYVVRRGTSNTLEVNNYPISTPGGKSGVCPTENLVSSYEYIGTPNPTNPYANRDPRLEASIVTNNSMWNGRLIAQAPGETDDMAKANASRTGYYLKKFLTDGLNLTQGQTAQHNWVMFRFAEILLNYAEAVNEAFGPTVTPAGYPMSAKDALMQVRNRASINLPSVEASTIESFRNAVKHERRVELAFEDHRYWDLLRWKDAMKVLNEPVKGVKITKSGDDYKYEVVKVADRTFNQANYFLPFTRSEIENSKGTLEQNPNY